MNKLLKKRILIISMSLALLLLINIGISYSYYLGKVVGNETSATISFTSAGIIIEYENNSGEISVGDIMPGWSATKNFSLSSNILETDFTNDQTKLWYEIILYVDQNDFPSDIITYTLTANETIVGNGVVAETRTNAGIATGANAEGISIGVGYFTVGENKHDYSVTFNYVGNGSEYGNYPDSYFSAHIGAKVIISSVLNIDLDGGSIEGDTVKYVSKGGTINLSIPIKDGYSFAGWVITSGDGEIDGNNITVNGEILEIIAKWQSKKIDSVLVIDLDGGISVQDTINVIKTGELVTLIIPTKTGYVFNGWEIVSGNADITVDKLVAYDENVKIKALWKNGSFDYTGGVQEFVVLLDGYYKIETWGAQGGCGGGYGGYSVGIVQLHANDNIYIYVGGTTQGVNGGFNGGGKGVSNEGTSCGGGGASHIAIKFGLLSQLNKDALLIVSGGGGGSANWSGSNGRGGNAGGYIGNNGSYAGSVNPGLAGGGTQTNGGYGGGGAGKGYAGGFGYGGNSSYFGAGGGAGFYGGGGGGIITNGVGAGGGGSSYIGNSLLTDKYMYCYDCETSDNVDTKTFKTTCVNEKPIEDCAKIGNGYARITFSHK